MEVFIPAITMVSFFVLGVLIGFNLKDKSGIIVKILLLFSVPVFLVLLFLLIFFYVAMLFGSLTTGGILAIFSGPVLFLGSPIIALVSIFVGGSMGAAIKKQVRH
ncbi:hypothetical protein ABLO27_14910 [Roseibium sp. SCPC15]|uniref:hypothetical protein n=1 Tax=Roseibium sp. SCP15 TaxID=3141376 RepID=UPI00333B8087